MIRCPEMVKVAEKATVDIIFDLVNQIIVECLIPEELELSTIVNRYKGKIDCLERVNYSGLKLTNQTLNIAERFIKILLRQQVDIDEIQVGFLSGYGATIVALS